MASPSRCNNDLNDEPRMFDCDETSTRPGILALEQVPGLGPQVFLFSEKRLVV
jgi:hypothetical protein